MPIQAILGRNPLFAEWALKTAEEDYQYELSKQQALLTSVIQYQQQLNRELDALLDLRISGDITEAVHNQKKAERQATLFRVQERQKRIETNIADWMAQLTEVFDFATSSVERFKAGGVDAQKSICSCLGWNWVLQEKKLTITRHKWFIALETLKKLFEENSDRLEPIKTYEEYRKTDVYNVSIPMMRKW